MASGSSETCFHCFTQLMGAVIIYQEWVEALVVSVQEKLRTTDHKDRQGKGVLGAQLGERNKVWGSKGPKEDGKQLGLTEE